MTHDHSIEESVNPLEDNGKVTEQVWWRDFVVEILGSILPGIVYTIFLSLLIVLVVHAMHTSLELHIVPALPVPLDLVTQKVSTNRPAEGGPGNAATDVVQSNPPGSETDGKRNLTNSGVHPMVRIAGGSPVLATLFVLFIGCLVGMINMRRNIDDLDRRSLVHIRDHQLVGETARAKWVARNRDEWQFPYGNLQEFLAHNGYQHLTWLAHWKGTADSGTNVIVTGRGFHRFCRKMMHLKYLQAVLARFGLQPMPWTAAEQTPEGFGELRICNKYYVDDLKFRVLKYCPRFFPSLLKLEAHVRFQATTWRLSEWLMKLSRFTFLLITAGLLCGWLFRWLTDPREFVLWFQAAGAAFLAMNFGEVCINVVKRVLHPSRVRELIFILSAVHIACQHRREFAEGLAHDYHLQLPAHFEANWPARQRPPAKAVITSATSPAAGTATIVCDAERGTSFDYFRKGPGDADFLKVGDDLIVKTLTLTGLVAGNHEFKVLPRNSRGTGPESDVSLVNVA